MLKYNDEDAVLWTEDALIFIDTGTITDEELLEDDISPECEGKSIE